MTPLGRVRTVGLLCLLIAQGAAAQSPSQCPDGRAPVGDPGIRSILCSGPGAACALFLDDEVAGLHHDFSVEPVVREIAEPASTAGIQVGDVLVAVDGRLITTHEAGRHLANLPADGPATLLVRRGERMLEVTLVPMPGCGIRSLTVT